MKLKRVFKFDELGLPTADVYVLTGEEWIRSKAEDYSDLKLDLGSMCVDPVIVRCDITEEVELEDILLPTSSPSTEPEKLIAFMEDVAQRFREMNIEERNWAFLIARTVPARASAMVHARPNAQFVQVDVLWGFPDGLLYFPHDTYFYRCQDRRVQRKLRHKGLCLLSTDRAWEVLPINPPQDWGSVLSTTEVETLSEWALRLANSLDHEVQLMALARISGRRGPKGCLPWHYTNWDIPQHTTSPETVPELDFLCVVRSRADLTDLQIQRYDARVKGFLIRPDVSVLRDNKFLIEFASFAAKAGLPILFEGSLLGHGYYVMARTGASVIPFAKATLPMEVKRYDKLVRDFIPAIIQRAGGIARVRKLPLDEAMTLLAQKLIEEAFEVWQCDPEDLAGELADVLEVVDSLREHSAISNDTLARIRESKLAERGGFKDLVYLEETATRPFDLAPIEPGTLPLYLEDNLAASPRPLGKREWADWPLLSVESTERQGEIVKLKVPLVPPVRRGQKVRRLLSRSGEHEVHAIYDETQLTIIIRTVDTMPPAEQLPLFPDFERMRGNSR